MDSQRVPPVAKDMKGSWSSANFRKMLLIESIASVLCKNNLAPASRPLNFEKGSRHESTSTDATEHNTINSKDLSEVEKVESITPVPTGASREHILRDEDVFDGSGNTMRPGEIANIAADPMANHTGGGINYRSLHWW